MHKLSLVTLLTCSLALLTPGTHAQSPRAAAPPQLTWTPATIETTEGDKQRVTGETGRLVVEEHWAAPTGRTISLQLVRLRATTATPAAPIVYLAGGPGGSGIASLTGDRFPLFQAMRAVADVIAIDQRGARSVPFPVCRTPFVLPLDRPASLDAWLPAYRDASQPCAAQWTSTGIDVAAYNTTESAADLAALGHALGSRLNLVGISYGTHLALATMRNHPALVERAVLAGVEGPDDTLKLPSALDDHLRRVAAAVAADPTARALVPDLLVAFDTMKQRLEETVTVQMPGSPSPVSVVLGPGDLQLATLEMTSRRSALQQFPKRVTKMMSGDYSELAQWALARRRQAGIQVLSVVADCASGASKDRRSRIERERPGSRMGDAPNWPFPGICDAWPRADAGDQFRAPLTSATPTLFISGSLDGRTPESNAIAVAKGFSQAHMLLLDPAGHDDDLLIATPEIGRVIVAFLNNQGPWPTRMTLPPLRFAR